MNSRLFWLYLTTVTLTLSVSVTALSISRRSWSYSTTAEQVNRTRIVLGLRSGFLHGYTHYLVPTDDSGLPTLFSTNFSSPSYSFTVQIQAEGQGSQPNSSSSEPGLFITAWELVDKDQLDQENQMQNMGTVKKSSPICSNYQIKLSYPHDQNRSSVSLCNSWNGQFTDSVLDMLKFGEYQGSGVVQVLVERRLSSFPSFRDPIFGRRGSSLQFNGYGDREERGPWRRDSGNTTSGWPSIPPEAVGGLTFTLYQDCSSGGGGGGEIETSQRPPTGFRPCSRLHNTTCIDEHLFCNSEPNCSPALWEYLLAAHAHHASDQEVGKVNGGAGAEVVDALTTRGYDEGLEVCGRSSQLYWHRTTTTYTYTYTQQGGYGGGGGGRWAFWILLTIVCAIGSLVRSALKTPTSENVRPTTT